MNDNIKKGNLKEIFILNSILVLIRIYYFINNNNNSLLITPKLENNIINYLKFLLENHFFYCKYIFNINLFDEDVTKNNQNQNQKPLKKSSTNKKERKDSNSANEKKKYKFLSEIALDIFFIILEEKENPELVSTIIDCLKLNETNSIFLKIDEYFCLEQNNNKNLLSYKKNMINLLNNSKISTDYCTGANLNNILYSIYFLIYFVNKQKAILSENDEEEEENETKNLINKGLEVLFNDCLIIFKTYFKKLKKYKGNFSTEIIFKIYDLFYDSFSSKYKDTNFNFSDGNKIYLYFIKIVESPKIINAKMKKDHKLSMFVANRSQSNLNEITIHIKRNKNRKETHIANENVIEKIKKKTEENKNEKEEVKNIFEIGRQRSSSQNIRSNLQETTVINENLIINNKFELKLKLFNNDNSSLNNNNKKKNEDEVLTNENSMYENTTSTSAVALKESKKESEQSEYNYTKDIANNNIESSDESDSENSLSDKLNFNSNYNLINKNINNNSINIIEEEKSNEKSSNKLYLHKNSSSSKNLKNNILSPNKVFKFEDNITNQKTPNTDFKKTSKFLQYTLRNKKRFIFWIKFFPTILIKIIR